jgi:glyoxylase-like metal-dependent hydrolase (beta-lactamase superfamily II)
MEEKTYHFTIGRFECTALSDGHFVYGPPMFPPAAEFLFVNAPCEHRGEVLSEVDPGLATGSEWVSSYTCLLIEAGKHRVLIDTGAGSLGPDTGRLPESLAHAGLRPEEVDLVVITHAHPDHLGGNTDPEGGLRFAGAEWVISEREWVFWTEGEAECELPEHGKEILVGVAQRNLRVIENRVRLVAAEEELLPGIRLIPAPGHTPGHLAVGLSSEGRSLVCVSDLFLHPAHVRKPEWVAAVDLLPDQLVATRRSLLEKAAAEGSVLMAFHFPFPGIGPILPEAGGWRWEPQG